MYEEAKIKSPVNEMFEGFFKEMHILEPSEQMELLLRLRDSLTMEYEDEIRERERSFVNAQERLQLFIGANGNKTK